MTKAKYRDLEEGYEEIELELDVDHIEFLEQQAIERDITVDEVIEELLQRVIDAEKDSA